MISNVIGRPIPNARPMINPNAESRFGSACTSRPNILLLHRAPAGIACSPNDGRSNCRQDKTADLSGHCSSCRHAALNAEG
jgi:hypothetical protein